MKGIVSYYERPDCQCNARQKQQLRDAGYVLQVFNLLEKQWEASNLNKFFAEQGIHDCVNRHAPQIVSGDFDPASLDERALLNAMLEQPTLIQHPLIFFRGQFASGFKNELVTQLLGTE
ncbi:MULTISPECIES: ArsC/Spx/MgsR family protein [unclassified Lentimonas]|uniref:ArsC/Spx/MgsR family protein n=1 Tax=unclassified Lentimonas TaxID=2630993 RepID=UPI00132779BA|nr:MULTISPECIES: ArsC/Spx/MgsR family protein [unclassified Lentimonas]CAA6695367.1 Unannotated [Lentimonas sp. CC10]CAA6695782.1 Unannotated [Lentimonas sp. CC19]CAA7072028.1 Unannotated [Lentimonas sp. CC11]